MECALCRRDRLLMNSHVVPEFLYKPLYDQKHRTRLVVYGKPSRSLQQGLRERLLCDDCEKLIQNFEDYFAKYWYRTRPVPRRLENDELLLTDIDYRRFKLFLLSVVWRASVSRLPEFNGAALGTHENVMRKMILKSDPGTVDQYPIYAGLIIDPKSRELWDRVMLHPLKIRVCSHWVTRIVFGGVSWTVMTSSHQTLPLRNHFLTKGGELRFTVSTWPEFARSSGLLEVTQGPKRHAPVNKRVKLSE